jgi:hypothetical protein
VLARGGAGRRLAAWRGGGQADAGRADLRWRGGAVGVSGSREMRRAATRGGIARGRGGVAVWGCAGGLGLGFDSSVSDSRSMLCVYLCAFSWHVGFYGLFGYRGCKPEQPIIISGTGGANP